MIPRNPTSLFLCPTNEQEIVKLISNLPNKRTSGFDHVDNTILKELKFHLSEPLTVLFNHSLHEGKFPGVMKLAEVVPLYKGKDKAQTTNYRPISLLITISKLLEKIMHKRTYDFLSNSDQIFASQYGFHSKYSCENAIQELVRNIVKGYEQNKKIISVYLDLSKAFDTIPHQILYEKMDRYGIRGTSLEWFKS